MLLLSWLDHIVTDHRIAQLQIVRLLLTRSMTCSVFQVPLAPFSSLPGVACGSAARRVPITEGAESVCSLPVG